MEQLTKGSRIAIRPNSTLKSSEKHYKPGKFNGSSVAALKKPKNGLTVKTAADTSFGFQKTSSSPHPTLNGLKKPISSQVVRLNGITAQPATMSQTKKQGRRNGLVNGMSTHHAIMDQAKKGGRLNEFVSRIPTKAPAVTRNEPASKQAPSRLKIKNGITKEAIPTHSAKSPASKSRIPTKTTTTTPKENKKVGFGTAIDKPFKIADDATTAETCMKFHKHRRTFVYPEKPKTSSASPTPKRKNKYKGTLPDFETRQRKAKEARESHKQNEGYVSWTELQKRHQKSLRR